MLANGEMAKAVVRHRGEEKEIVEESAPSSLFSFSAQNVSHMILTQVQVKSNR